MATRLSVNVSPAALLCVLLAAGCGATSAPTSPAAATGMATGTPVASSTMATASPSDDANSCEVDEDSGELPALATCRTSFVNGDEPTPPLAEFSVPETGWFAFNGTAKDVEADDGVQRVGALFVTITNLTIHACEQQSPAVPPIGPSVGDLAAGLAALPPFEVTSAPNDVTAFGSAGKHLEIRVPLDQPSEGFEMFTGCEDNLLKSWIAPGHVSFAFNGYTAPGDTEEFWILDVDGKRVVIAALMSANASAELVAERQAVLDSVVIVP
jgi:hypothetical protein